jgi:hypothetical protein
MFRLGEGLLGRVKGRSVLERAPARQDSLGCDFRTRERAQYTPAPACVLGLASGAPSTKLIYSLRGSIQQYSVILSVTQFLESLSKHAALLRESRP